MTCGACTSAVEGGFKDVAGLVQFNISLLAERAVIIHNPMVLPTEKIIEIIDGRGFDARIISSQTGLMEQTKSMASAQFKIFGVIDAAAATELETKLQSMPGVKSASMSLSTSRLTVDHQPQIVGLRSLVESIETQGYNALVADNEDNNAQLESLSKFKEIYEWRRAFRISLGFAIPVFLISMIFPMFLPFLDFSRFVVLPGLYLGDIICLILTLPV